MQGEKQHTGSNSDESIVASEANEVGEAVSDPIETRRLETVGKGWLSRVLAMHIWTPQRCRYDADDPPNFTLGMNILLGFVRMFILTIHIFDGGTILIRKRPRRSPSQTYTIRNRF